MLCLLEKPWPLALPHALVFKADTNLTGSSPFELEHDTMENIIIQPTTVNESGLTDLIRNLGRDCSSTQFIREFTQNGVEAVQRTGVKGRVIIDYDKAIYEQLGYHKICFIDTGDGMDRDQMLNLLNSLSASGSQKNTHKNYGVGAKISAFTRNHAGIVYDSWKDGKGHRIIIGYDEDKDVYGIMGHVDNYGTKRLILPLSDEHKPDVIKSHGTRVTLLGMRMEQDTMLQPDGINGSREAWIAFHLNSRFFRLPEGVEMSARVGYYRDNNTRHNYPMNIRGQKNILDGRSIIKGVAQITDARVHWWVMPKGSEGKGRELVKGHTAIVVQDEIFDISDSRSNRSAYFGVLVGRDQVIIYVEPNRGMLEHNTTRTHLVNKDGSPVSWDLWQDEFSKNMPPELREFLDKLLAESSEENNNNENKEKLKSVRELYRLSRYQKNAKGKFLVDPESVSTYRTGDEPTTDVPVDNPGRRGRRFGSAITQLLTSLVNDNGVEADDIAPDGFPDVQWVSEEGTGSLVDRAAEFIENQNLILANRDFDGFKDLVAFFTKMYGEQEETTTLIVKEVKKAFELALMECVTGALCLKNRKDWTTQDYQKAISREALTTAVMPRYWMVGNIKRSLGNRIKSFQLDLNVA